MEIFSELAIIIMLATVISVIMRFLKQPLIVGYILTGLLSGPYVFNLLHSQETIELFSKMGITILLFIVGLNLSPRVIREVGKVSLATGVGQVVFTSIIGYIVSTLLGIDRVAAVYVAIALTFSSTIIILKLLSDKGELNALYGKVAVGFLLVQDIIATIILVIISSLGSGENTNLTQFILLIIFKGAALLSALLLISRIFLPKLISFVAKSQELLFLFSIAWGLALASLFTYLGFSVEIGALVAGVILASTPYSIEISSRLKPLRDFFILLFFILLGSQMVVDDIGALLIPAFVLSVFVIIGNPLIMMIIMNLLGFSKRTGFQAGLTVAQISEFSLILATLAFELGHVSREILSLITLVGIITIAISSYLIMYNDKIYPHVANLLNYLQLKKSPQKNKNEVDNSEVLLFGYHRVGQEFIDAFQKLNKTFLVVDFNPESIKLLEEAQIPYKFGDAQDVEFLEELNLKNVKMVVSTVPDFLTNQLLIKKIRAVNKKAITIAISHNIEEAEYLYELGANYVVTPHYLGAQYASKMIERLALDTKGFKQEKEKHIKYIHKHNSSHRT